MTVRERLKIPYPVIVEGAYDKLRLENVIEAQILTTDGFGVFNHQEKTRLFRTLAARTPVIVLTDSDGAGKLIRSHLTSASPPERLIHLYVPRIEGKEKRKQKPSKAGTLGVEGMDADLLRNLFLPIAGAIEVFENGKKAYAEMGQCDKIALIKGDGGHRFYADASCRLSPGQGSGPRQKLCRQLSSAG